MTSKITKEMQLQFEKELEEMENNEDSDMESSMGESFF